MQQTNNKDTKKCGRCKEIQSIDNFTLRSSNSKYLNSHCKFCSRKRAKEYYERTKEAKKEQRKQYRENNKEIIKERNNQYIENNRESIKEYKKKYAMSKKDENQQRAAKEQEEYRETNNALFEEGERLCKKCQNIKTLVEFNKNKLGANGYSSSCKECLKKVREKEVKQAQYNENKEDTSSKSKNCVKCKITKDLDEFPKVVKNGATRRSYCKDCTSEQYYEKKKSSLDYKPPLTGDEAKKKLADYLSRKEGMTIEEAYKYLGLEQPKPIIVDIPIAQEVINEELPGGF